MINFLKSVTASEQIVDALASAGAPKEYLDLTESTPTYKMGQSIAK